MSSFLGNLNASFGTKIFDPEKKIPDADIAKFKEALHMTPTSFGLQPFHVVDVREPGVRAQIRSGAMDQSQVTDASHLFVFCARTDVDHRVDQFVSEALRQETSSSESLASYAEKVRKITKGYDEAKTLEWSTKQAYIALGFGLAAAAELGVDSCPMEGFGKGLTAKVLGLPDTHKPVILLTLGYRKVSSPYKRMRFPEDDLFSSRGE
jgi:nitroreductase